MDALLIGTFSMSAFTFGGTIYFNRKNLITAKYIDTITLHRIKRTDAIRNEVADITTDIDFSLNTMSKEIDDKTSEYEDLTNDPETQSKLQWNSYAVYASIAFKPENTNLSISDLVYKFNLLKLRLNPNEDNEIIDVINYFIKFYTDGELKFDNDIKDAKEKVIILNVQFQMFDKDEWEKVKSEAYGNISRRN
jgi:hypothetical protein